MADTIDTSSAPISIPHPAGWEGRALLARKDWKIRFSDDECAEFMTAVEACGQHGQTPEACAGITPVLPNLAGKMKQIQSSLEHGSGVTIIEGLPVEHLLNTSAVEHNRVIDQIKQVFAGVCSYLGTPLSQSAAGDKVFSVRNEGYADDDARARGPNTSKRLSFHTDRCDVIAFLCLRQAASGGENQVVSSIAVYNRMMHERPDLVACLMQPYYYKRHNVDTANTQPWCRQPIFSFTDGFFAASLLRVLIERAYAMPALPDMTDLQREALDELEAIAERESMHVSFTQSPGDVLLLNNWVTLHRRTAFVDDPDPMQRRHILRAWLSMPNSRPIHPLFLDNYGATEAGAIRGGMIAAGNDAVHHEKS